MKSLLTTLALTITSSSLIAQVFVPPTPPAQNTTPTDIAPKQSTSTPGANNGLLGNEIGLFDPTNDSITWNGKTWSAGNNRVLNARFEKYLNEPENLTSESAEYRKTIDEILSLLSPHHKGGPVFGEAVALLPKAALYPGDAKLCDSLSNAIYTAILSRRDVQRTKELMKAMQKEKKKAILDGDWKARTEQDPNTGRSRNSGEGQEGTNSRQSTQAGRGAQSLAYGEHIRRIAEIEASTKTRELESKIKTELAKVQYQALMVQFFVQRRFQHVIMASRFYNMIWSDGDGTLYLEDQSDIKKVFSETLGVSPTVSTLDSLANEAMRDVDKGVEVFSFLVDQNELDSASKRLTESYLVGEFMPSINTLPRFKKRKVLSYVRNANILFSAMEAKDFDTATKTIEVLKGSANDFDATRATAAIAALTRASNMHIMMAKNHLAKRDTENAQAEIRQAMEIWPQNPKLNEVDRIIESGAPLAQAKNDFDRLFAENNYREVYKRRAEFISAIIGDSAREANMQQVEENLNEIERAIGEAEGMQKGGLPYAAWEKVDEVHEKFPDDPKLNQFITALAPNVANFTIAINKAKQHEARNQLGSALSYYYRAKDLHPTSDKIDQAINRLVDKALITQ